MNSCLKKALCLLMALTVVFTLFVPAAAEGDVTPAIVMDAPYSGNIENGDAEDYYKFTTTEYGRVRFTFITKMKPFTVTILDSGKKEVKKWVTARTESAEEFVFSHAMDAGTYYLKVTGAGNVSSSLLNGKGTYEFALRFTPEKKDQPETDADKNNDLKYAKVVKAGSTYAGKILTDGEKDFYKFTLNKPHTTTIKFTSKMEYYGMYILNADGGVIWSAEKNQWNASKKSRTDEYKLELSAGVYYIKVDAVGSKKVLIFDSPVYAKGNYQFELYLKSAGATSIEPNDSIIRPNKITFGKKVVGHLSITDRKDFFEVKAPSGGVMVGFVSNMPNYSIRVLDLDNKEVWSSKNNALEGKATSRKDVHEFNLKEGTYFIVVEGGTGKYSFQTSKEVNLGKVKSVKYYRTATTLTLEWAKVSGADGYEIFKYDTAKKKFVKVGSTTTKRSIKLSKLKSGTTYEFKVRAYKKLNDCAIYGPYSEEKATTTVPAKAVISSVKAGSKSATVNWKAVTGASGYQVFYTTDKDFDYASKTTVKDAKATSKTIKNLKKGKKYYFKVKAYKVFGGKNVYGSISSTKSVKVK